MLKRKRKLRNNESETHYNESRRPNYKYNGGWDRTGHKALSPENCKTRAAFSSQRTWDSWSWMSC